MINLLLLAILGTSFFGLLVWGLSFYWRRVADSAITTHFRAAECIIEQNHPPPEWVTEINHKLNKRTLNSIRKRSGMELLLEKLDKTIEFFERGSFHADAETKKILLSELANARDRWSRTTWDELLSEQSSIQNPY